MVQLSNWIVLALMDVLLLAALPAWPLTSTFAPLTRLATEPRVNNTVGSNVTAILPPLAVCTLKLLAAWKPPAGFDMKGWYDYADGSGGIAIVDVPSAEVLLEAVAIQD